MQSSTKKRGAIFVSVTILLVAAWAVSPPWTRTDSVRVTAIDDGYDIFIHSAGRWLVPVSPEGPFPKWGDGTRLFAEGRGERVEIDGVAYQEFTRGKNLRALGFSECAIYVSEAEKRLIVRGELAADRKCHINHSGQYDNITIAHPEIVPLMLDAKITDIDHRYIRARGRFDEANFTAAGKTFEVNNGPYDDPNEYEIVAYVESDYFHTSKDHLPYLFVVSYKKVSP
jgi:hypothetical protein